MRIFLFSKQKDLFLKKFETIIRYLKKYKREVVTLGTLSLVIAFFEAAVPYFAGNIIDSLVRPTRIWNGFLLPFDAVFFFLIAWVLIQATTAIFQWYLSFKIRFLDEKIYADYIVDATSHLIELPISFHKAKKIGDIESSLQRAAQDLSTILNDVLIRLLPQVLSIFVALIFAFFINPLLAVLLITSVIIFLIVVFRVSPKYSKASRKMRKAYSKAYGEAYDTLLNVQSVKQAGAELYEKQKLYKFFHLKALALWKMVVKLRQQMTYSQRTITLLTQGSIYLLSIYFILQGKMTIGQLVMFNGYVGLFLGPFTILSDNWNTVQGGLVSIERAERILRQEPEPYNKPGSVMLDDFHGKVEFRNVHFTYGKDEKTVLKNISFIAEPGQIIALVGESGVGKSTMMDLVSRLFEVKDGLVLIDDHDIRNINLTSLRSKIAVVPQEIILFNDTIRNNIRYGSFNANDKQIHEAARIANAANFIEEFPKKYTQIVGERGVKLSTGQKQRLAIARAVLRDPRILILDEPTSALDAKSEKLVEEALSKLMRGRTTFIIAHRLSTVRHANKILVLDKGEIVEQGTHEELIEKENGIYQKLYNLQIGLKA